MKASELRPDTTYTNGTTFRRIITLGEMWRGGKWLVPSVTYETCFGGSVYGIRTTVQAATFARWAKREAGFREQDDKAMAAYKAEAYPQGG